MKKILIATKNKDKYNIVEKMLSQTLFNNYNFYNLDTIDEKIEPDKEVGNINDRATAKARKTFNTLKNNDFDYIIGIDDNIKIKGTIIEDVKLYINKIINENYLEENEIVSILRSFTFISKEGKEKTVLTEIPYMYKSTKEKVNISENDYPLDYVMVPLNSNKPVSEIDEATANEYFLIYSNPRFNEIKEYFNI